MCTWRWWIIREWIKLTQKCSWYSYKHISCPRTFQESFHNPEVYQVSLISYHLYRIIDTVSLILYHWYRIKAEQSGHPFSVLKKGNLIVPAISVLVGPPGLLTKSLGAVTGLARAAQLFPWECRWGLHKDCDDEDDDLFNTYAVPHAWALLRFPLKFTDARLTPAIQWTNALVQQDVIL